MQHMHQNQFSMHSIVKCCLIIMIISYGHLRTFIATCLSHFHWLWQWGVGGGESQPFCCLTPQPCSVKNPFMWDKRHVWLSWLLQNQLLDTSDDAFRRWTKGLLILVGFWHLRWPSWFPFSSNGSFEHLQWKCLGASVALCFSGRFHTDPWSHLLLLLKSSG